MRSLDAAVLASLRTSALHSFGSELAGQLGVSLATLETRIGELRGAGFEIEQRPGLGYRLLASPDRLIADDLWARLGTSSWVREILVFKETDSTNDVAAQMGRNGAQSGLAVFAEKQNAGRGRFGRKWQSAPYLGLWGSLLLRPELALHQWPRLTTAAAVAIAEAIEKTLGWEFGRVQVKWPNDLQIGGCKVAGILIETGADRSQRPFAVLGTGINVNHEAADFPSELQPLATSLREAGGKPVDRAALAVAIFEALEKRLARLGNGFGTILEEATRRSALLGRWIQLRSGAGLIEGMAEALDGEGQLLVRTADGGLQCVSGGEVSVVPAAR